MNLVPTSTNDRKWSKKKTKTKTFQKTTYMWHSVPTG